MRSDFSVIGYHKIRFALAGCDCIANHFEAIKSHTNDAEIVGVYDVYLGAVHQAAEKTHAKISEFNEPEK